VIDWFSGIGGFRLAFERAGHEVVASCEIEEFARAVYEHRFGEAPTWKDVQRVHPEAIPPADIWTAGFPCQDASSAGLRRGLGPETRSGLIFDLLKLAAVCRPKWLLLENVPGLLSVEKGRGFGRLLLALDDLGFDVAWRVLDAQFFGVPQRRRRVFIVAGDPRAGADPRAVLFEPEGVSGDHPPRRKKRSRAAGGAGEGAPPDRIAGTVTAKFAKGTGGPSGDEAYNLVAATVSASSGHHGHSSPRGDGSDNLVVGTVQAHHARNAPDDMLIPFDPTQITHPENRSKCEPGDPSPTLCSGTSSRMPHVAFVGQQHGSDVGEMGALRAGRGDVQSGVPFLVGSFISNAGTRDVCWNEKTAPTLRVGSGLDIPSGPAIVQAFNIFPESGQGTDIKAVETDVAPACTATDAEKTDRGVRILTLRTDQTGSNGLNVSEQAPTLDQGSTPVLAFTQKDSGQDVGEVAPTLRAMPHAGSHENGGGQAAVFSPSVGVRRLTPRECERLQGLPDDWTLIPFKVRKVKCPFCAEEVGRCFFCKGRGKVRERATAKDTKRYKVIGNGVAIPCVEWIARRFS
jgi:DNA (cytosine-5)-methyltransferase 1